MTANLMVNYDLPWNPNRIEQRFGRIHRIGQKEVCHLWNMVADGTREGDVFKCLLQKLDHVREALGDQVFDVLGEMFENVRLKDLLIDAIRFGEDPQRKMELLERIEGVLDIEQIRNILSKNALCDTFMNREELFRIKADMEKAEARKLQPYFVRAFFSTHFLAWGAPFLLVKKGEWK